MLLSDCECCRPRTQVLKNKAEAPISLRYIAPQGWTDKGMTGYADMTADLRNVILIVRVMI